jgi:GNAT superfamily N-acetyltransferase
MATDSASAELPGSPSFEAEDLIDSHPMLIRKHVTDDGKCRLLLYQNNRFIAQIGLILEASGQLAVAGPKIAADYESSALQVLTVFLPAILQHASQARAKAIRLLIPESPVGNSLILSELDRMGFTLRARIESWTVSTEWGTTIGQDSEGTPVVCEEFDMDALDELELPRERLRQLIESILANSVDLNSLPKPQAEELMSDWIHAGCRITLATIPSPEHCHQFIDAGLIVVAPSAHDSGEDPCSEIRYVGVRPEMRQQRIAIQLISHILERDRELGGVNLADPFSERIGPSNYSAPMQIQVWCDLENTAAMGLYRRCGFQPNGVLQISVREVEADTSRDSEIARANPAKQLE